MQKGIPFDLKLPVNAPVAVDSLIKEQFDAEIEKGMADIEAGRVYVADEVEAELKRNMNNDT